MKRRKIIRLRVSDTELVELDSQAAARGVNRSAYLRALVRVDRKHSRLLGN